MVEVHLSSVVTFVALFRAWNEATVKLAAISEVKSWTSQLGVVKELAVQPAVICAQDKPFSIAGASTAVSAATDRNRTAIISRYSLLLS